MDSLTPFGEASSLYYTEKCESPKCVEAHKNVLYLHFNHKTDLTFLIKTFTIKVRSLCVVLMISPLVVRRTFYLIVNDRDLALKIRLLFSSAIQLSVVGYIIQPIVVNVNGFLQNFKIIF